ncbi:class I SAM-dependent methyltransferase [Sphingoaurantiacus capsulatus]|uniref:Class I SAM-dependent methyltransferase n=1 Tax=Sphingoaurantiacus capsulatus TaxID=1771310 RepID=A0ABV7X5Q5_9SPHN
MPDFAAPLGANDAGCPAPIDQSRRAYAEGWAINAAHYERQGLYAQLAERLGPQPRLLDLGCGLGHGLAALRADAWIGVDENPYALAAAADRLGVSASLIQSDLLRPDPALNALGSFDAVTLWFPGTHPARVQDPVVRAHGLTEDARYVVAMQLIALRLAAVRLREGGVVQIVDRAAEDDPAVVAAAYRENLRAMAAGLPLALTEVAVIPYTEPAAGIAVGSARLDRRSRPTWAVSLLLQKGKPRRVATAG